MATNFVDTNPQLTLVKNGSFAPNADGEVEFFSVGNTGDSNRKDTYNVPNPDATPTVAQTNPNPVPLDGNGRLKFDVFLNGNYNTVTRDKDGNQVSAKDNVQGSGTIGTGQVTVDNVTELKGIDTDVSKAAFVQGTTAINDGGQSHFYYDSTSVATDNGSTIIEPTVGAGRWLRVTVTTNFPFASATGLKVTNNSGTPDEIVDIAVGHIKDTTDAHVMQLTSAFTKTVASTFAVGTGLGGLSDDDTLSTAQWLGIFLLGKSTSPTSCDVIIATTTAKSLSDAVATAAGFDISRLIGYGFTDGTSDFIPYILDGNDKYLWSVPPAIVTTSTASRQSETMQCPPFQNVLATVTAHRPVAGGSALYVLATNLSQTDTTPSATVYSVNALPDTTFDTSGTVDLSIKTDGSSRIGIRPSTVAASAEVQTIARGWQMDYTITDLV
jgi:hypothetical protein